MKFNGILSVGLFLLATEVTAIAGPKGLVAAADSAVISVEKLKRDFDIARKAKLIKRTELTERDASAEAHGMAKRVHTLDILSKRGFFGMTPATVDKRDKVIAVLKERDAAEEDSTCCDFYLVSKRDTVEKRIPDEDASTCCDFYITDKRGIPAAPEKRAEDDSTCCDFYISEKRDLVATPEKRADDESTCCDFYITGREAAPEAVATVEEKREAVPEPIPEAAEEDSTCCDFYLPGKA
ncbi:hypothetical protein MMC30_007666 [Trapelia coarctata]|nr:hypothetical protein [Trapelia coarctata]